MNNPPDGASYIAEIAELKFQNEQLTRENAELSKALKQANRNLAEVEKRWDETATNDGFEAQRLHTVIDAIRSILTLAD